MKSVVLSLLSIGVISAFARPARACASVMWEEHNNAEQSKLYVRLDKAQHDFDAGKLDLAFEEAEEVLSEPHARLLRPWKQAKAARIAGESALATGYPKAAEKYLGQAYLVLPELAGQYALAQIANGHVAEARAQLEATIKLSGLNADGWAALAEARRQLGDTAGALAAANEALKLKPEHALALRVKAALAPATTVAAAQNPRSS